MTPPPEANPSRLALLDAAVAMVEALGPAGFKVDEVLIESGTSSSSLYHHFGSRQGLLVAAQDESYRRRARAEDRRHLEAGYAASTTAEFLDWVASQIRRMVTDPGNVDARRTRLTVAAAALSSPELARQTTEVQERMFRVVAELYDHMKERGLINPDLDGMAYNLWLHGMVLGRTATELGSVDAEAWLSVAIPAALAPLRLPGSA